LNKYCMVIKLFLASKLNLSRNLICLSKLTTQNIEFCKMDLISCSLGIDFT
jgi:hypothetical protein